MHSNNYPKWCSTNLCPSTIPPYLHCTELRLSILLAMVKSGQTDAECCCWNPCIRPWGTETTFTLFSKDPYSDTTVSCLRNTRPRCSCTCSSSSNITHTCSSNKSYNVVVVVVVVVVENIHSNIYMYYTLVI